MKDNKRIFGLDVMRATAITMVVTGHLHWILPPSNSIFSQLLVIFGFLGVELFFVLSGFLIGQIIYTLFTKDDFTIKTAYHFLKRRWYRTLPNYYLILLINIGIAFIIGYSIENVWKYFVFQQNFATPLPQFFTESWSLAVEEYAYLLLPLTLLFFAKVSKLKHRSNFFIGIVLCLTLLSLIAKCIYHFTFQTTTIDQWNSDLKSVVIYRIDSIFIGVIFAWIASRFPRIWKEYKIMLFAFGSVLIGFVFIGFGFFRILIDTYTFYWNVLYLPVLSLAVACLLPYLSTMRNGVSLITKPIIFISKISYSMYLLHYGIVLQLMKNFITFDNHNTLELILFIMSYLLITILLSYTLYRFYEKPFMDKRDDRSNLDI